MKLQKYFRRFLIRQKKITLSEKEVWLRNEITKITGQSVKNIHLYKEAFSLRNANDKKRQNYERLEFLGDSILGSIISSHLFETYPNSNEGYLTQMKAKIVSRKNLNKLGENLGLTNFLQNSSNNSPLSENISGNLLEALVGAIYLDLDYEICRKIVLNKLLTPSEINKLEHKIGSYKSLLLEWSQKQKSVIKYETTEEVLPNKSISFRSCIWLNNEKIANASETSKKKAEEKAAQRAFYILNKKEHILEKSKAISG